VSLKNVLPIHANLLSASSLKAKMQGYLEFEVQLYLKIRSNADNAPLFSEPATFSSSP
jgi:hypothetical protein